MVGVTEYSSVVVVATDVGLWMSLPAFAPALVVVAAVIYVARRDRRAAADSDALDSDT